jgi:hypothetical protein
MAMVGFIDLGGCAINSAMQKILDAGLTWITSAIRVRICTAFPTVRVHHVDDLAANACSVLLVRERTTNPSFAYGIMVEIGPGEGGR